VNAIIDFRSSGILCRCFFGWEDYYDTHPFSCPSVNLSELVATRKHNVYLEECPKAIITGGQTDLILPWHWFWTFISWPL